MRKTSDLVEEMLSEAKKAWLVAIAVGFEKETKFVFSSRRHPLEELNQLVQKGGSPIGLLLFDKENSTIQGSYRPVSYTHLRAHETDSYLVCRLLLETKKT